MQYRIQFLDRSANVIREWSANAQDVAGAIKLIVDADWPPRAVTMRVLEATGVIEARPKPGDAIRNERIRPS